MHVCRLPQSTVPHSAQAKLQSFQWPLLMFGHPKLFTYVELPTSQSQDTHLQAGMAAIADGVVSSEG